MTLTKFMLGWEITNTVFEENTDISVERLPMQFIEDDNNYGYFRSTGSTVVFGIVIEEDDNIILPLNNVMSLLLNETQNLKFVRYKLFNELPEDYLSQLGTPDFIILGERGSWNQ